jgi:hypothetical protein
MHHGRVRLGGEELVEEGNRPVLLWHVKSEQLQNQHNREDFAHPLYYAMGKEKRVCLRSPL